MIFVDFLGDAAVFATIRDPLRSALGALLRVRSDSVVVRRIVVEGDGDATELWVELSSEEQVYRRGREIAAVVTDVIHRHAQADVWVMFRVVPLSHAFLNGQPRARGGQLPD